MFYDFCYQLNKYYVSCFYSYLTIDSALKSFNKFFNSYFPHILLNSDKLENLIKICNFLVENNVDCLITRNIIKKDLSYEDNKKMTKMINLHIH